MKILQVNKFLYPKGGADKYFLDLTESLKAAGHETAVFAMAGAKNLKSPYQKYFVSPVEFNDGGLKDKLKIPGRMIYSLEAKKKFGRELNDFKPDIIHCHNIYHQISPSILEVASKRNIPVIMHLHDYKLICPNYRLFTKGHICQECLNKKSYWPCLYNNCYESYPKSFLTALEMTVHHKWLHIYEKNIDLLIAPSEFMRRLVIKSGWPKEKIITLYNPAPKVTASALPEKDYLLYFGRLTEEKGIKDLAQAAKNIKHKLHIVGTGPEEANLKKQFQAEIEDGLIIMPGRLEGQALKDEIAGAQIVIFPSLWPENMPLALLESLANGKIVLASRVGGLPEIIQDTENGFLFEAGNIRDLESKIKTILGLHADESQRLKLAAIKSARALDPDEHLDKILKIYSKLAKKSG